MQRFFLLMLLVISTATVCTAQSISGNGFEVHTRLKHPKAKLSTVNRDSIVARINAIPDTALQTATFVFTAADISDITAIELALIDSRNQRLGNRFAFCRAIRQ